ncbi:MAG TPA: sigma-54-dependent Fis family transcriptional regulator [Ignavibacteriaceae bacterium]|nr:sigma-54-dependent Fis family transcriptional regulator [Ignavibacteriaceae bacterium]
MSLSIEYRQSINKLIGDFTGLVSGEFMNLSNNLKEIEKPELRKEVDSLFRKLMEFNREIANRMNSLIEEYDRIEKKNERLTEEKRRLEILYSSGILFLSEIEMKKLMEKAIDTIVKELNADQGFIVLLDDENKIDTIVTKNMDMEENSSARDLSTSVIRKAIDELKPFRFDDLKSENEFALKTSIIKLDLNAVLCVPLVSGNKILGTVYIDRRHNDNPFNESDLTFLISFGKQIVKGIEISLEISALEEKLEKESNLKFNELRKVFKCDEIVGNSSKLFEVLKLASKVAQTDASVLIVGENGTGKDVVAKAIHNNSKRSNKPFIAINCGAIPSDLLESELFGYESGAFTGASKSKPGRLELAEGGTIFLDEIGELNVNLQAKLLRVIQTKEIERLGGIESRKINVRFVAATNKDLQEQITQKKFREDLYYRLKVIEIRMPSLRERKEDIQNLVEFFLKKYSENNEAYTTTTEVLDALENYEWPGNVRELENVIQRCIILAKSSVIDITDIPPEIIVQSDESANIKTGKTLLEAETEFRRMYIIKTLRSVNSKSEASKLLGINRTHFYKLLSQLNIPH